VYCKVPKQVDHQERRKVIAASVWRLTAAHGLDSVSMRQVAADAGISLGQVQHYFANKDDLLAFALDLVSERVEARIAARVAALAEHDEEPEPRARVHALLIEMLPLDEQRHLEAHVGFAFLARAAVEPKLAERLRGSYGQLEKFVVDQVRLGQRDGMVPLDVRPEREARTLLAMIEGLTAHVLIGDYPPAEAELAFDTHLDELFGG
jgi:AcrR family transcriptional regulator